MSKKGTSTFVIQRATAVILAPLGLWFLFGVVSHLGATPAAARAWLREPVNAFLFGSLIVFGAIHMRIGMAEIIIDYIHSWMKDVLLVLNWLVSVGAIVAAVWSIYRISLVG